MSNSLSNFNLIWGGINTYPLYEYLTRNDELFEEEKGRQSALFSPHIDTRCIYIRGPKEKTQTDYQDNIDAYDYNLPEELVKLLTPVLSTALTALRAEEIGYILLVELMKGGEILRHRDEGVYADYYSRAHIPIYSHPGNIFYCGEQAVEMAEGEVWTFNHRKAHWVENNSIDRRIHLIVDFK